MGALVVVVVVPVADPMDVDEWALRKKQSKVVTKEG